MNQPDSDAFAEAILERVAELAYEELRPHLNRWARGRQADRRQADRRQDPADVVHLADRRPRRVA